MLSRRTDLALEAHDLHCAAAQKAPLGTKTETKETLGYCVTSVTVDSDEAQHALGKPKGLYVTLDLARYWQRGEGAFRRAVLLLAAELKQLIAGCAEGKRALIVGLGNAAMTPDAIGPFAAQHVLVTRHLKNEAAFSVFSSVSVLQPGVLGKTGVETAELVRGAVETVQPDVLIAIDALASARLARVCTTVQLSDTGIVPGSGVGNHRNALNIETLGVPVIAVGVPTVVDALTLSMDVLEEAGIKDFDMTALRSCTPGVMVTPRDIDAQVAELARIIGFGVNLALHPNLDFDLLCELTAPA